LFELLPHITRLVPMADRYFSTKTASEKATEAAMVAMADGVRGDLGQVTKAHAGLYKQLQEQSAQIAEVVDEVKRIGPTMSRVMILELQVAALGRWVKVGGSLIVALLVAVIVLLARGR
jgi:hypothetical protein